jgi:hypothetical protein
MITTLTIAATGLVVTPALATPASQDQQHKDQQYKDQAQHPDYSNNSFYRLGNKEGLEDHQRNVQRTSHNHHYKTDEDKAAHDYGYQQGWKGQSYQAPRSERNPQ